jgi:hypothetical protein
MTSSGSPAVAVHGRADGTIIDSKSRLKLLLDSGLGDYTQEQKGLIAGAVACALQRVER